MDDADAIEPTLRRYSGAYAARIQAETLIAHTQHAS